MMTTPRRKACVECRQQKIRCDVEQHKTPHEPCSRCRKMGLECRILPTSTRNLRQTKAEMRRELEELKWNMRQGGSDPTHMHATPTSNVGSGDGQMHSPLEHGSAYSIAERTEGSRSMSPSHSGSAPPTQNGSHPHPTLPRILDGFVVDSKKIEDCFNIFFTQYHAQLPILDATLTPNEYYEISPFLFWSIIVTGSRRYTEDTAILDKTSQLITPLAFSSMALRSTPIPVIQGLLILCTWRLPTNSMYKDMTHVLCGAAVHLATQIGLHVTGIGQDFARMPLKKDQDQKILRAKLWMHCVIASIRSSCAEGIPPLVFAESFFDGDERERAELATYLGSDLLFLHKVYVVVLRAMTAIVKMDLKSPNCDIGVLRSLISIFDSQLQSLAPSSPSELDTFQLNCARIHVLSFHFFANPATTSPDAEALSRLYSLCVSTMQTTNALSQTANFIAQCPSFIDRTLTLTGFVILKLARSPLAQHLDLAAGKHAYFQAVQFSKNMSMQTHDLGARCAAIMTDLWSSAKVFQGRNGRIDPLALRLRTRLSMSVSFDMFWYWREEFGHMSNPYNGEESKLSLNAQAQPASPHYEKQEVPNHTGVGVAPLPVSKFPGNAMNIQQAPIDMNFNTWDGSEYSVPPMLDQFPDYDWAASFELANDWPNPAMATLAPENAGYGPLNFG